MPSSSSPIQMLDVYTGALGPQHQYTKSAPSAQDNLTQRYGLSELAASVARFDVATGQKQKLRKSYKNQISDLPGKHNIPTTRASLLPIIYAPPRGNGLISLKDMDLTMLNRSLALDPAKPEGIRGFNPTELALSGNMNNLSNGPGGVSLGDTAAGGSNNFGPAGSNANTNNNGLYNNSGAAAIYGRGLLAKSDYLNEASGTGGEWSSNNDEISMLPGSGPRSKKRKKKSDRLTDGGVSTDGGTPSTLRKKKKA